MSKARSGAGNKLEWVVPRPVGISDEAAQRFGRELIREVKQNTRAGLDADGNRFAPYSNSYRNSATFKRAGKGNTVNLRLFGDMQAALVVKNVTDAVVTIGFDSSVEEAKAHGHFTGGGAGGNLPVRQFLGLRDERIEEIAQKYQTLGLTPQQESVTDLVAEEAQQRILDTFFANFTVNLFGDTGQ